MRVHNPAPSTSELDPQLAALLQTLRARRGFDAKAFVEAKARMLNEYLAEHGLTSAVVAVSGGLDSAVVLGLVAHARRQPGSPITRIVAVQLPVEHESMTNQQQALEHGRLVARACGVEAITVDLTATHQALQAAVDGAMGETGEAWASGQLVSYARTPAIYYITSLLTQAGQGGLVVGTTNRDEGAYLGYVGKASDGMVDVQLIADLHKSEVRQVAALLDLPEQVLRATPTGDMFDGRSDEQVFGAPYDFVETYLLWRCEDDREQLLAALDDAARRQWDEMTEHVEHLHAFNAHKYLVGSPAVHLNLLASAVPGGWTA